jgi:hypothetical protein
MIFLAWGNHIYITKIPKFTHIENLLRDITLYMNLWLDLDNRFLQLGWLTICTGIAGQRVRFMPEGL